MFVLFSNKGVGVGILTVFCSIYINSPDHLGKCSSIQTSQMEIPSICIIQFIPENRPREHLLPPISSLPFTGTVEGIGICFQD